MRIQAKSYRPELHYMRGPGPRWREKNGPPIAGAVEHGLVPLGISWLIPAATAVLLAVVMALALA
jgi:hypothetical protein